MYQKKQKTWYKHFDFMLLDFLCVEISFFFAYALRFRTSGITALFSELDFTMPYRRIMAMIIGIHIALVFFTEPYSRILKRNASEEMKKVLQYNVYVLAGLIFILFIEQMSDTYSRMVMFSFPLIDSLMMFAYRYAYKQYLRKEINNKKNQDSMLLVASYGQLNGILHKFYKNKISTVKIVGIILADSQAEIEAALTGETISFNAGESGKGSTSVAGEKRIIGSTVRNIPIVGTLENMYEYARKNVVDEVLICMENDGVEEIANAFISMGITVHVSIQNLVQIPRATVNRVNGISVITASVNTVTSRQLIIKRVMDIFFGIIGSLATVVLTLVIAPMIWIADPGPVFFRQERVGKNGRIFKIWKFRTMYTDAEARKAELMAQNKMSGLMFKMDDDPRIIGYGKKFSLGKFLRESSIDELPQSFNILAGSMSVVGTRPPTVKEYEQYELHHKGRLATKPGLTGMWQISGRSDITDFEEVVRLDKEYIDNFSLGLDLEIILKTFKVVLGKEGSV
ncbi:MAG: sugar transferase [Bacteroidales bacterium]|nr:sugar transferase [Clostridium sp.]MCM1203282.1 sugar transferase [Bacteroidales bacterium]